MDDEVLVGGRNLLTPHAAAAYPGVRVISPGEWDERLIVASEGQTIVALGGERAYAYETVDGGRAEGFVLEAGDRATLVRAGLPFELAAWRIARARTP